MGAVDRLLDLFDPVNTDFMRSCALPFMDSTSIQLFSLSLAMAILTTFRVIFRGGLILRWLTTPKDSFELTPKFFHRCEFIPNLCEGRQEPRGPTNNFRSLTSVILSKLLFNALICVRTCSND